MLAGPGTRRFRRVFLPGLILVLGLAGCGQSLGTITLAGQEVPKAKQEVAVGNAIGLGPNESQTATFSGASVDEYRKYVKQLQRAGWKKVSETQDVASMTTVFGKDKASAVANWTPAGGIILNVQVPKSSQSAPASKPQP